MSECTMLGWITFVILTATLIVITWYTVETYKLRRESQLQTELENRPFISLVVEGSTDPRFKLVNVGKGPATNVVLADVDLAGDPRYRLHAEPITHIAPGQQGRLRWTVRQAARSGVFEEIAVFGETFPDKLLAQRGGQLHVTYRPIVGDKRYETVLSVRELTDEFPEPRITVI